MKVLIVSFYYDPELGAAPCRITNLAKGLKAHGVDVEVLTCLPNYPKGRIFEGYRSHFSVKEMRDDIPVYRYWTYATISKNPVKRVLAMIAFACCIWAFAFKRKRIKSYDRIIVQSPPILVAASALLLFGKCFHKSVVLNVSDLWPLSAVELGAVRSGSSAHKCLLWQERFIYRAASAIMAQSQEIANHVHQQVPDKPLFLYRNLQPVAQTDSFNRQRNTPLKIVYAGLFGVAQDILSLIRSVDFGALGVEMHLYGGGNQLEAIKQYIEEGGHDVYYHGFLSKKEISEELKKYDLSIIPLVTPIQGAVPSKIFDLLPEGIPILFSGGGEGARIVSEYHFGLVSNHADYETLAANIRAFVSMDNEAYSHYVANCLDASKNDFSFDKQMARFCRFLSL